MTLRRSRGRVLARLVVVFALRRHDTSVPSVASAPLADRVVDEVADGLLEQRHFRARDHGGFRHGVVHFHAACPRHHTMSRHHTLDERIDVDVGCDKRRGDRIKSRDIRANVDYRWGD